MREGRERKRGEPSGGIMRGARTGGEDGSEGEGRGGDGGERGRRGGDQEGVDMITKDLLRGAGRSERGGQLISNFEKLLLKDNAKSLIDNVFGKVVYREKVNNLILKEKEAEISNLKNKLCLMKEQLSEAEASKKELEDEKSSKLSLTIEVDSLKRELEKVIEAANLKTNNVVEEKERVDELVYNLTKQIDELKKECENTAKEKKDATKEIQCTKSALDLKERQVEELRNEKEKEIEVLRSEKEKESKRFQIRDPASRVGVNVRKIFSI